MSIDDWKNLQKSRAALLIPTVKGLIKLGVEMHGYSPCDIWNMLTDSIPAKGIKISCAHVFLFFIEDFNLYSRLERKLAKSEEEMLKR